MPRHFVHSLPADLTPENRGFALDAIGATATIIANSNAYMDEAEVLEEAGVLITAALFPQPLSDRARVADAAALLMALVMRLSGEVGGPVVNRMRCEPETCAAPPPDLT